jgi:hypothetical protein
MLDDEIQSLLECLTQAERDDDVTAVGTLTTSDFTVLGPLGFLR